MKVTGIFNRDGGTLKTLDAEAFAQEIGARFEERGHRFSTKVIAGKKLVETLDAAKRSKADVVLVAGGDGTVSCAAGKLAGTKKALGVLPAGTMNLFARSLGIPLDLKEAASALAGGSIRPVDMGSANDRRFVHHFTVGLHPQLLRARSHLTYRSRWGKILATIRAFRDVVNAPAKFPAELQIGGETRTLQINALTISNNRFGTGHLPYADFPDRGELGIYLASVWDTASLAKLGTEVMLGSWKTDDNISEEEARKVTVRFPELPRDGKASIDGELIELEAEVVLQIHPQALNVLVPDASS